MKVKYHKFWKYSHRSTFVNTFFFTSTIACTRWVEPHHMHVATWGESKDILTYYLKKISTLMVATHTFFKWSSIWYYFCFIHSNHLLLLLLHNIFFSRWWKWMYVIRTFSFLSVSQCTADHRLPLFMQITTFIRFQSWQNLKVNICN